MFIEMHQIAIRRMKDNHDDFTLLFKWLTNSEVLTYYEGINSNFTLEKIIQKYQPRIRGEHYVTPCMIEYLNTPIGYLQYYQLQVTDIEHYEANKNGHEYGLDIFIGETKFWNKGLGTLALKQLIHYLFTEKKATDIYIDPQIKNTRAIRSYEKCGFRKVKVLPKHELHNGEYEDCMIMRLTSKDFI
ncbi:acetyltransferase [Anaerobacillus sp. CMMVII]|uniref:GNAT family N-acetyltransferase n=1 Tax=Anaerobacillus sp. CMMVII TaxID=2755588 RepID=UPI0021B72D31|nr:GNAT family N-acetyltransferase [Anaerobacillus sp. CMMVII]MCT8138077.1 acetyltransferase [Anaerobacillus sp. CMMVII]